MDKDQIRKELQQTINKVEEVISRIQYEADNANLPEHIIIRLRCYANIVEKQKSYLPIVELHLENDDKYELGRLCNIIVQLGHMIQTDILWLYKDVDALPQKK